ncbi:MAG TPA: S8 family serine peptidase [Gaiellaceae bacterium]|nr:S8 family serine peptidase [Gaiellaceae bacterium]
MFRPRGLLAAAAAVGALVAASPAPAIEMSLRPGFLPPVEGSGAVEALSLAAPSRELIVAVDRDRRAAAILTANRARRLGEGLWLVPAAESHAVVRRLGAIGALRYAHPNDRAVPRWSRAARGDPLDPDPWWMPRIGADRVTPPGPGFPLTIVDDGIDTTHPEFAARPIRFLNVSTLIPQEDFHGTMMSSVAAAPLNGVGMAGLYPQASLRIADTGRGNCADVLAAVEAAVSAGPSVINMSWGFSPPTCLALHEQILRGLAAGSLFVAATGNMRLFFSPPAVPAIWPHVLTIGSINPQGTVSYFSNEGMGIDLAAPGEFIVAATPTSFEPSGYSELEGTSFSAAFVSAAGAWIATRRHVHATQLSELLRESARDTAPRGWDEDTGFGVLDLRAALKRPLPAVDPAEPNDDVNQVRAGGLFKDAAPALTHPGRERASLRARLDRTEDPVDVYRVFVPPGRSVRLRLIPTSNVDVEVFRGSAHSCYYQTRRQALRSTLIRGSYGRGRSRDSVAVRSRRVAGEYVYACVYKPRDVVRTAAYSLSLSTR